MTKYHLGSTDGYVPSGGLPQLRSGDSLSIDDAQKLIRGIDRASVVMGNGYQVRRYSNSTVIQPNQYVAGAAFRNFQVFAYVDENQVAWATVTVGTVNRCVPKMYGTSLYLDQVDNNNLAPKVQITAEGWIAIAATYEANFPFPRNVDIRFTTDNPNTGLLDTENLGGYPIAKVKIIEPSSENGNTKSVSVIQYHTNGNLGCSRIKVSQNKVYWNWWTI